MIPIDEFRAENNEIVELCNVLNILIDKEEIRQNHVMCELINRFIDRVAKHLRHEDRAIYSELLSEHTQEASRIADHFMNNARELKRIMKEYNHEWCQMTDNDEKYQHFIKESQSVFKLVCNRIEMEEKKIFPHFEK